MNILADDHDCDDRNYDDPNFGATTPTPPTGIALTVKFVDHDHDCVDHDCDDREYDVSNYSKLSFGSCLRGSRCRTTL